MDGRIKKLCEHAYLVCGKVICFDVADMFDMSDPEMQKDMIAFAEDLYTDQSELPKRFYGDETVCVFRYVDDEKNFTCEPHSMGYLKDDIQVAIRKGLAEYV